MAKKIAIAVWILTAAFLGILVLNYFGNRKMIENFDNGNYQQNELGFLGFTHLTSTTLTRVMFFISSAIIRRQKRNISLRSTLSRRIPTTARSE